MEAYLATRTTWKVFALFNHDLAQIHIGAIDAPAHRLGVFCAGQAHHRPNWQRQHNVDWMEQVEEFPTRRQAKAYADWLHREGAFEGVEDYTMGLAADL